MLTAIGAALLAWKGKAAVWWIGAKLKIALFAAIAAAVVLIAFGIYLKGRADVRAECNAAALRAEIATLKHDLAAIRKAEADEKARAEGLDALAARQAQKLKEYEDELAKRPDRCVLTPDDSRRLR